jgi:hypothetical protein
MGLFMYSAQSSRPSSTQAYLGSVALCPLCRGQKPKDTFKIVEGQSICKDCQDDLQADVGEPK